MTVWCPEAHNMTTQISHIETKTASSFRHHPSYIFILHFLATPPCQLSLIGISALMASLAKSSASISLDSGSRHFFYHSKWNSHHLNSIKKTETLQKKNRCLSMLKLHDFPGSPTWFNSKMGYPTWSNTVQHGDDIIWGWVMAPWYPWTPSHSWVKMDVHQSH